MSNTMEDFRIDDIIEHYPKAEPSLVMLLQDIQERFNYLPRPTLVTVSKALNIPLARVYGVATFYKAFSLKPRGRIIIKVCKGTACHVRGAQQVQDEVTRLLSIGPGETTPDMKYTLEVVNCLGACAMAPVVIVAGKVYGEVSPSQMKKILEIK